MMRRRMMRRRIAMLGVRDHGGRLLSVGHLVASVVAVTLCASSAEAQWRLALPDLTVGQDSVNFFANVADVLVRDDRVYVADGGLRRIVAFDRTTGQVTATAGRKGQGPSEFQFMSWLDDCGGDVIFTSDSGLNRVSVFSPDLDHLRTFRLSSEKNLAAIQCAGTGTFVAITRNADPMLSLDRGIPTETTWRATHDIVLFEPDGSLRAVLGTFLGEERYREATSRGYSDYLHFWGLRTVFDSSPEGFVIGTGETSSLVRYDDVGTVLDTLALGEGRVAISQADIDARVRDRIQRAERLGRPIPRTRSFHTQYPYPSHFPAYSKALVTGEGFVWIERFRKPYTEQPFHWKVFTPDGRLLATVDVPSGLELIWVGDDHVAGVVTDELGVQTVEVRRILRE